MKKTWYCQWDNAHSSLNVTASVPRLQEGQQIIPSSKLALGAKRCTTKKSMLAQGIKSSCPDAYQQSSSCLKNRGHLGPGTRYTTRTHNRLNHTQPWNTGALTLTHARRQHNLTQILKTQHSVSRTLQPRPSAKTRSTTHGTCTPDRTTNWP